MVLVPTALCSCPDLQTGSHWSTSTMQRPMKTAAHLVGK
jgi:hypothetical protein